MADIVWSDEAKGDFRAIGEYFERTSPQYAQSIVSRIYDSVEHLERHPKMGRMVPEVEHEDLREVIREGYRIIYQLRNKKIEIVAVVHSRQDVQKKFRGRSG